jgi:hypothetical protein
MFFLFNFGSKLGFENSKLIYELPFFFCILWLPLSANDFLCHGAGEIEPVVEKGINIFFWEVD